MADRYGAVGVRASAVRVSDAFVVKYAAGAQAGLPLHRDDSHFSITLALNGRGDFEGGGTFFPELGRALRPERGHVVSFPGAVRHGGAATTRGVRYIIAAFLWVEGFVEPQRWAR